MVNMNYRPVYRYGMLFLLLAAVVCLSNVLFADIKSQANATSAPRITGPVTPTGDVPAEGQSVSRTTALIGSLTVFLLAIFVGVEVITKVPPTLHTPLMSGSNAISGITIIGAILVAGHATDSARSTFGTLLGAVAVVLAMINVVGGFVVTHRMLMMFKKR